MSLSNAVVAGLAAWNYAINRRIPPRHYVPANLMATAAVVAVGRTRADSKQLGMRFGRSLGPGLAVSAAVAAGSWAASRFAATAGLFDDQRVSADEVGYQTMVRIPLGTVILEEVAFRSVLPALIDGPDRQVVSTSSAALFGLWHIIPTLNTLDINDIQDPQTRARIVAAGVVSTAVAGLVFDKLRLRSGSVVAPMLVHWSSNAVSYLIASKRQLSRGAQAEAPE